MQILQILLKSKKNSTLVIQSMSNIQEDNFKKFNNDKNFKFQWGIPQSINQSSYTVSQNKMNEGSMHSPNKPKPHLNGISFQDLPVKQSEIMTAQQRNAIKNQLINQERAGRRREHLYTQYTEISNQNKQTIDKLNQLKNQFQILKGLMIDSRIGSGNNRRSTDKISSLSQSNVKYSKIHHNTQLKTGENIRAKQKGQKNRSKRKQSDSQISEKDLNFKKSNAHQKEFSKQKNKIFYDKQYKDSRIKKSKHTQHHSLNPQTSRSKRHSNSRVNFEKLSKEPNMLLSNNLLERQSLQLQLRESLEKIQTLIQNQILLKTKNHELQQALKKQLNNKQSHKDEKKVQQLEKKLNNSEKLYLQVIEQNRQLAHKIGRLEADAAENQAMVNLLRQQKNYQISNAMNLKMKFANLQIDNKRLKMEKDLDNKDHQYQMERIRNQVQIIKKNANFNAKNNDKQNASIFPVTLNFDKQRIKQLQQQLQQKERKYRQLLQELQNKNYQKQESQFLQMIERLQRGRQQQGQSQIIKQLQRLKNQLNKVKNQSQNEFGLQSKVVSLQQALKRDNQQKRINVEQYEKVQRQFEDLKQRYKNIQREKDQQVQKLIRQNNKLRIDLKQSQQKQKYYQNKSQHLLKQIEHLNQKIQDLEITIRNYEQMQSQLYSLRSAINKKEQNFHNEIKDAKKRIDEAEFQSYRAQQQSKLNIQLNTKKLKSQIQVLGSQLKSCEADKNYYLNQMELLRQQNQALTYRLKDFEFQSNKKVPPQNNAQYQKIQQNIIGKKIILPEQKRLQNPAAINSEHKYVIQPQQLPMQNRIPVINPGPNTVQNQIPLQHPIGMQRVIQQPIIFQQRFQQPNIVQQPIFIQQPFVQPIANQNLANTSTGYSARLVQKVRPLQAEQLAHLQQQQILPSPSRLMQRIPINRQPSLQKVVQKIQ